jgi:hypothetical protein
MSNTLDSRINNAKSEVEWHVMYALYSKCDSTCGSPLLCRAAHIRDAVAAAANETVNLLMLCDKVRNNTKLTEKQKARFAKEIHIKSAQHTIWSVLLIKKQNELKNACCFCEGDVGAFGGNNPAPLAGDKCCDACNKSKVIPARTAST